MHADTDCGRKALTRFAYTRVGLGGGPAPVRLVRCAAEPPLIYQLAQSPATGLPSDIYRTGQKKPFSVQTHILYRCMIHTQHF